MQTQIPLFDDLQDPFLNVLNMKSLEEIVEWLKTLLCAAIDFLSHEDEKLSPVIKKVLSYIGSNRLCESKLLLYHLPENHRPVSIRV